jgi:hypothetical protein
MEAADVVDAQSASTNLLENAQSAFPTASTRIVCMMVNLNNLLPRSPDRSVT